MPPLPRTPEPELMDAPEQAEAYAGADFSATDALVLERFQQLFPGLDQRPEPQIVDLGCGPGNITFLLARAYPAARVVGVDGSAAMLALAHRRAAALPGPRPPGFLELLLPPSGGWGELSGACHALVSNSLLHHLHDPRVLWRSLAELAAPGAAVYIKDLRRPDSAAAAEALLRRHLPDAPAVLQHDYLASLHAAFRPEEVEEQLRRAGLAGLQVAPVDDRYLEVWGCLAGWEP